MNIDIKRLKAGIEEYTSVDETYSFSKDELNDTSIIELNNVDITGNIHEEYDNYIIDLIVKGTMILPCSLSLKPVNYPFEIEINEEIDKKNENTIDILPIVWENILMEIPIKVTSSNLSDLKTQGDGWKLITDNEERGGLDGSTI